MAPPGLAEDWDNSGLQVGDPAMPVKRIMVALDPTPDAVKAAISSECQLLLTHHPLIFKPQKSISTSTQQGRTIHTAIGNGLAIVCMHTNYDIVPGGLNDLLADRVGLAECQPLQVTARQELVKLVVFVPAEHLDPVRSALFPYAEQLGLYRDCSFVAPGEGTFTPLDGAAPFIGTTGKLERVAEQRLELLLDRANLARAVKALLTAHPYEEPAFDIYPLLQEGTQQGLGRLGRLPAPLRLDDYAARIGMELKAPGVRYVGAPDLMVSKVALCSGSGASLLRCAARAGADVLVTGDVKYHEARDAEELGIALIDAGHFPTEVIMVPAASRRLTELLAQAGFDDCTVMPCSQEKEPFRYCQSNLFV